MQNIFKRLSIVILIGVLGGFTGQIPKYALGQSTGPAVSITEIGVFEPAETEWVEIFNKSDAPVDLTGWKFFEENTNHGLTAINGDLIIDAGEYAIIASKSDKFQAKYPNFTGTILDSSWGNLKEAGELIGLKDKDGNFVEQFTYPQILDAKPQNDSSLERVDVGNWRFALKNSLGLPATAEQISAEPVKPTPVPETTNVPPVLPAPVITAPVVNVPVQTSLPTPSTTTKIIQQPTANQTARLKINPKQALPSNLQGSTIEIHGYLVFGDIENLGTAKSTTKKTTKKATTKKSTTKTANKTSTSSAAKKSTKETFQNGDLSDAIRITELSPAPDASDENGEWIEIFNSGTETVNLGNWQVFDTAKKTSPYLIPDTLDIPPNSYIIFGKTDTKISLNNGGDEIFIANPEGKIIDSVSYPNSQKSYSYALVQTAAPEDSQSTNLANSALAKAENREWQWVDEPTPGQPNPVFENISGTVSAFIAGGGPYENLLKITMQNGGTQEVGLSSDVLDPKIAETILIPGSQVSLQAQKRESGYEIKKIADVKPPEPTPKKETNYFIWIVFAAIGIGIFLNAPPLIRAIKEWRAKKRAKSKMPAAPEPIIEENSLRLGE